MSDYTRTTNFAAKDFLAQGDSNKLIVGAEHQTEYDNIATAVTTKYDSDDLATQAQAEALTSNIVLMTPLRVNDILAENGGLLLDIQALVDPNADRILGWDDSANDTILFTLTAPLQFNLTALEVNAATAGNTGVVETATQAEVNTGTDTLRYVTPATLEAWEFSKTETKGNTVDQSVTSSTTFVDLTGCTGLVVDPATHYTGEYRIPYTENVGNIKIRLFYDQTAAESGYIFGSAMDDAETRANLMAPSFATQFIITTLADTTDMCAICKFSFQAHATLAGMLKLQFAQQISSANATTVRPGATLSLTRVVTP